MAPLRRILLRRAAPRQRTVYTFTAAALLLSFDFTCFGAFLLCFTSITLHTPVFY
jgi:hypothetical protein